MGKTIARSAKHLNGNPPTSNAPIRLAIIGCGGYVHVHIRALQAEIRHVQLVALVDTNTARAQTMAQECFPADNPPIFTDHAAMLAQIHPDAVIVSTPHALHYQHCRDAISAGAHVLVDKPMVTNLPDARKLVAHAARHRRLLLVAVQGMYTDAYAYTRQLLADRTLGELQLASGIMACNWMKSTVGLWRQNPALSGGGELHDATAHVLAALLGLVNSPLRQVFCQIDKKGCRVDINAAATISFANGCLATIASGGNCITWDARLHLQAEHGMIDLNPYGGHFSLRRTRQEPTITAPPKNFPIPTVSPVRNFFDAIRGQAAPRCDGHIGIRLAELLQALYASAKTHKPVTVRHK